MITHFLFMAVCALALLGLLKLLFDRLEPRGKR